MYTLIVLRLLSPFKVDKYAFEIKLLFQIFLGKCVSLIPNSSISIYNILYAYSRTHHEYGIIEKLLPFFVHQRNEYLYIYN